MTQYLHQQIDAGNGHSLWNIVYTLWFIMGYYGPYLSARWGDIHDRKKKDFYKTKKNLFNLALFHPNSLISSRRDDPVVIKSLRDNKSVSEAVLLSVYEIRVERGPLKPLISYSSSLSLETVPLILTTITTIITSILPPSPLILSFMTFYCDKTLICF